MQSKQVTSVELVECQVGRVFGDDYANSDGTSSESGVGSWQDTKRKWVILGENVYDTYIYAALAAHYAHILQTNSYTDPESINWRTEAENAWTWAQAHQTTTDETVKWGYNLPFFRMYAAASLYRLTGDKAKYESKFISDFGTAKLKIQILVLVIITFDYKIMIFHYFLL